jgi:hypothetical protein
VGSTAVGCTSGAGKGVGVGSLQADKSNISAHMKMKICRNFLI